MQAIVEFCRRKNIWFVCDEVYSRLIYDRPVAPSVLQFAKPDDPVIAVNSFSKTWAMTGWRLGWMVMPKALHPVVERLLEFNTSGGQPFLQRAAVAAIEQGESFVAEQLERFRAGRDLVTQRLGGMKRVRVTQTDAAFYLMFEVDGEPDSHKLAIKLVDEARVGMAPGAAFGTGGEGFLRLCFASSTKRLGEAMDRLEPFLD
jgi:aspartate/methionine/tyrosine aminotransferase